jgi:hypothetical protein
MKFTEDELIAAAKTAYGGKPICVDMLADAMQCDTLEDAVSTLVLDSAMWDSPTGDPFDTINS